MVLCIEAAMTRKITAHNGGVIYNLSTSTISTVFFSVLLIIEMSNVLHTIIQRLRVQQERVGIVLQSMGVLGRRVSCIFLQSLPSKTWVGWQ